MRTVRIGVWVAGGALCGALLAGAIRGDRLPATKASFVYVGAFVAITIGIVVWQNRPEIRTGWLLTAYSFAVVAPDLRPVFPHTRLAVTVGLATSYLVVPLLVQIVLGYPSGRLRSRLDRAFLTLTWAFALSYAVVFLLLYDPRWYRIDGWAVNCRSCGAPPLTNIGWRDMTPVWHATDWTLFVLALLGVVLVIRKLVRASLAGRRVVLPLSAAALFVALQFVVQIALYGSSVNSWRSGGWFWIITSTGPAIPLALAAGLLWGRTARGAVADLVVELERIPPGGVRDALARTLGDPSLELALWLPERHRYVDSHGRPFDVPKPGPDRAATVLGPSTAPIAALLHDPALLERPALLESVCAAARLALENERLHAELRAQLAELSASRMRIVEAGDAERRRLERDLHDGAQQRLLAIGLALQLAQAQVGAGANGTVDLIAEAERELRAALDELRELARGIHPAILTDQGLAGALRSLAERSPVPVTIGEVPRERLGPSVEAAAYFLVSESLANVAKHACASAVRVSVVRRNGDAIVDVEDDGVGGAEVSAGSGLRGLLDRVEALHGTLHVESPRGRGTRIHAEIPCAS